MDDKCTHTHSIDHPGYQVGMILASYICCNLPAMIITMVDPIGQRWPEVMMRIDMLRCRAATVLSTIYRPPSKSPLDYYTLQNSWSFPFNWISKDFFRRSKNSWKNKNWSIFGHSVRVWSIFSKTPVAALHTNIGREKWLIYCSCLQFSNCEMDYCVS